jgi:hypothetical protein
MNIYESVTLHTGLHRLYVELKDIVRVSQVKHSYRASNVKQHQMRKCVYTGLPRHTNKVTVKLHDKLGNQRIEHSSIVFHCSV